MKVLIFKTDIRTREKAKALKPVFSKNPVISKWNVDTEDIDKVLRIETSGSVQEKDIVRMVRTCGFHCEVLPD